MRRGNFVYLEVIYLTETSRRRGESARILYTETCVANAQCRLVEEVKD